MIVAPVRCLRQAQICWKPKAWAQSRIHLKISLPTVVASALAECGKALAAFSPPAKVVKQETTACIS